MKVFKIVTLLILSLCVTLLKAQTSQSVSITVNILPPYSPYYSDYSGRNAAKVLLIVRNLTATTKTIKLTGQVEGDNGIRITTKSNYVPLKPIILNPNEIKQLNGTALTDIFDLNTLNVYGIDKSRLIYTSRLPEGNYNFCIQAVDINTNQVVSSSAPLGCTTLSIAYPDAPIPISPAANFTVTQTNPQSVVFNWVNAGFAPAGTQYILQVAEMPLTNADPNQILNSTSFPLINKTINGLSYVLNPSDPPLKIGKRYAWRVKAFDPTGATTFKNNGISQAYQFRYGDAQFVASSLTLISPKNNIKIDDYNKLSFQWNFTDNTSKNDAVSFVGTTKQISNSSIYELYLTKIKTDAEIAAEKKVNFGKAKGNDSRPEAITVPVNNLKISYKDAALISGFVKDDSNYEWHVKHLATGTVSEKQYFTIQLPKHAIDYSIALAGRIRYRYYADQGAYNLKTFQKASNPNLQYTEAEAGYSLANTNIQALRVQMTVPVYRVTHEVKVMENGKTKIVKEEVDSIPTLNNIRNLSSSQVKITSILPITSGKTDNLGNFNLNVPISKHNFKIIDNNITQAGSTTKRALVEGIVIQVNDLRFSDPNWFIFPTADKSSISLNEEVVQIYDYNLNVAFNTKVQRDYKGKMYLLKKETGLVRGEVDNIIGQTKDVLTISKSLYFYPGKPSNSYQYNHDKFSVVGVKNVQGLVSLQNPLSMAFKNLVSGVSSNLANYTLYFEPDANQDALYFSPQTIGDNNLKKYGFESTVFSNKNITKSVVLGPKYLTMKISGRYLYKWQQPNGKTNTAIPLPEGTKLVLVKGYISSKSFIEDKGSELKEESKVATTTVGKNGSYNFDLGLLNYDDFNNDAGKSLLIIIDDPYYTSAPETIVYNQNEDIVIKDLVGNVRQFTFSSKLVYKKANGDIVPVNQMDVYLCRKKGIKPLTIPINEGDPDHGNYFKKVYKNVNGKEYDIIDKTVPDFNGVFTFKRLALPSKDLSDEYFILAEPQSTSNDNYITEEAFPLTGVMRFWSVFTLGSFGEQLFTDAQTVLNSNYNANGQYVLVVPQNPYIDGAVYPYSNTATSVISGVKVELFDMTNTLISPKSTAEQFEKYFENRQPIDVQVTGTNGRFLFDKFYGIPTSANKGKLLRLTKVGFLPTYKPIEEGIPLIKGHRANLGKVYLDLPLELSATVVDNSGNGVPARIIVGKDFSWSDTYNIGPASFVNLKSPKGLVSFTIIPNDKAKYKTTVIERTVSAQKLNIGALTVQNNMHNIAVIVLDKNTKQNVAANVSVTNIKETPSTDKFTINGTTFNTLSFPSAGTQFDIRVVPTGTYTIAKTQVKSDMTKTVTVTVYVEPAVTLTCHGTYDDRGRAVDVTDYNIIIDDLDEDEYVVTKKPGSSQAIISKIPANKWIYVGASKKGFIGQTQAVLTNSPKTLNFKFTDASKIGVDNLYGFGVELTGVGKLNDGSYLVSGRLNPAGKSSNNLKLQSTKRWLKFTDVRVKPVETILLGKKYITVSVLSPIVFDENELDALLYNKFNAIIKDKNGLTLAGENLTGSILGQVAIDPASFSAGVYTSSSASEGDANYLYLNSPETKYVTNFALNSIKASYLKTFTTENSEVGTKMLVSNLKLKRPTFNVVDNFTITPVEDVLITSTGISALSTIATNLANVKVADIEAKGVFNLNLDNFYFTNAEQLNIGLRDWRLEFSNWNLTKNGFVGSGNLNALGLTIPFTKLQLTSKAIGFGNFSVSKLTLLNKFPVTINANQVMTSFGFDKGYAADKGAWSVAILANSQTESLASLPGLPDLGKFDQILINNINLYDTGNPNDTRILLTENQPYVTLNGIAKYQPFSVFGGLDFISFRGSLDMDVPNLTGLGNVTYDLKYQIVNNEFVHVHDKPFKNLALDANGVKVYFSENDQVFTNGSLKLRGDLRDKDPKSSYAIPVQLDKSSSSTRLHLLENQSTPQRIYLSGDKQSASYLDNAVGEMKVVNKVWNNFTFSGNMTGSDGINASDSKLSFIVKGDLVANESKIGVQNMDAAGMKGINFTYDFTEKAIIGSASISQNTDFADLSMDIDVKIGSSNWYIFSNGVANNIKNTPFNQAAVGMMIGNSSLSGTQLASLHKHFKDNDIPTNFDANFKSVKGILMVMSTDIPIPIIPTFNLDLDPVAHASLTHGIYGNLYYNLGFGLSKQDLSIVVGARLGAFIKLGVGASIGLACAGINLHADVHADASGKLAPFAAPGSRFLLDAGIKFTLEGQAYVGAGVCNSSCETPCVDAGFFDICSPIPCFKKDLKKKMVLGLSASVTDASPYFHFKGLSEL